MAYNDFEHIKDDFRISKFYSIGYGNRKIATFISLLAKNSVQVLVDVRSKPFSRFNPAYRRNLLEAHLKGVGIEYLFQGNCLGGRPIDQSVYINSKLNYNLLAKTQEFQDGIKSLLNVASNKVTAIMCSELDPAKCHRKTIIGTFIEDQYGISLLHIDSKGEISNTLF